ncbi:MAG: oligosaccharide flippase family protein [Prevotellaceae bacterium]|jgi:O-antigen/teichoic acid export membrane protein|nr:oligosaccharide flippase family protein [Prevotellaceae bacterium]
MTTTKKNIIANYVGRTWSFLSVFIFVPFYLKLLGSEAYGIVSFFTVLLGMMAFADAGLTATLNREFARTDRTFSYKANLLTSIEVIYCFICLVVILFFWVLSPIITKNWLDVENIPVEDAVRYVKMIGVCIAFQLPCSLYQGGLLGLQKQVLTNSLQIVWSLFRSGFLLWPLYFFPTLDTYFGWTIGINVIYLLVLRNIVKKQVKTTEKTHFSKQILADVWRYAVGMMIMSMLSAVLMQADKLITSNVFALSEFGYYTLASTIAQAPLMIVTPIGIAILPKLTGLISGGKQKEMLYLFRKTNFIITVIASIVVLALIIYMPDILFLWTRNTELVASVTQVARILCLGSLFQALPLMPFYLGIANGHTKTNVLVGIFSILFLVPAIFLLIQILGIIGAGIPWLVMSFVTFFVLGYLIFKKFAPGYFHTWLLEDTLKPFFALLILSGLLYFITYKLPHNWYVLGYCAIFGVIGVIICALMFNRKFPEEKVFYRIRNLIKI